MAIDTHGVKGKPWVGFDLDGTLATYDHWRGIQHIGEPVKPMCDLIKKLRDEGKAVKILTARVAPKDGDTKEAAIARVFIAKWCKDNLGFVPPITHEKDSLMETLYDDRVKAVEQNTGKVLNMAKFNDGDTIEWYGKRYKVIGILGSEMRINEVDPSGNLKHDGDYVISQGDTHVKRIANAVRTTNPIVRKAMNAQYEYHTYLVPVIRKGKKDYVTIFRVADEETAKKLVDVPSFRIIGVTVDETRPVKVARNVVGRDKRDAAAVEMWAEMFRNFIDWQLPKYKDMERARKSGEQIIKYVEEALGSEGGKAQLRKMGWTVQKMRETMEKAITSRKGANAARNAAGYVDASSVVLYPGDAVVFKAQYSSHKDDDEWLERNSDTVREVRGNEVKLGPSANDWAKKSDLMVWHNAARSRNAVVTKALNAARVRNAEDDWVERFEVGGVYHGPYMNKDWLAKVLSRTDSSIRVAIKSRRDKTWHGKDEQVTLRINKRQAEEDGTEVAKGYGWEFWANDFE